MTRILCDTCNGLGTAVRLCLAVGRSLDAAGDRDTDVEYRDVCLNCLKKAIEKVSCGNFPVGQVIAANLKKE